MNQHQAGTQRIRRVPAWSTGIRRCRGRWQIGLAGPMPTPRGTIHDAGHGARPGGRPATFAPGSGGTVDRPA